jgi:hypothetical protein
MDYRATANPRWAVSLQSESQHVVLHLREPGIDWLHYALSPEQARTLGELLISSADKKHDEVSKPDEAQLPQSLHH